MLALTARILSWNDTEKISMALAQGRQANSSSIPLKKKKKVFGYLSKVFLEAFIGSSPSQYS